jgi:hypothetical protein
MLRGDGSWITTRWNMKKGSEGYRGVFSECPEGPAPSDSHAPARTAPSFNFRVQVLQD